MAKEEKLVHGSVQISPRAIASIAYQAATYLGMQNRLIRKRNRPLSESEIRMARDVMAEIVATDVPGLSGSAVREEALV